MPLLGQCQQPFSEGPTFYSHFFRTMLDTVSETRYNEHMTTTRKHPPIYYKVRSVVRWTFWTGIAMLGVVYLGRVVDTAPTKCDVQVNRDFTWSNPKGVDISQCSHPVNVILHEEGTWEWEQ